MILTRHMSARFKKRVLLSMAALLFSYLLFWLFPGIFSTLNANIVDRLFLFRSKNEALKPTYDDTVVHIDINDSSLKGLKSDYLNRSHYARVILNLSDIGVSAQLLDFIFRGPSSEANDLALTEATREAEHVYYGMSFSLSQKQNPPPIRFRSKTDRHYLDQTAWNIRVVGNAAFLYSGTEPRLTFPPFAEASRGLGFLSIKPDPDGAFRRSPLMVRYGDRFYPSLAFRAVCDYLQVPPERISLYPGEKIVLAGAERPFDDGGHDIVIPIDAFGNMIINFIGAWGSMKHYSFEKVYRASDTPDRMSLWEEELSDKIALISDISTGATDVGPVPTDPDYPLSGIHSNIVHTILTESFLKEAGPLPMLGLEMVLAGLILVSSLYFTTSRFSISAAGITVSYLVLAGSVFLFANTILNIVRPVLMIFFSMVSILIVSAIENARLFAHAEKAREVAERDLEIGRQIQAGFFPEELPSLPGWEVAAHFQAARQVAGDFYDVFPIDDNSRLAVIVADICDKGVGAALFMALTRSLMRAFSIQRFESQETTPGARSPEDVEAALKSVVSFTNDYLAETHSEANMFATLFFGILEPENGTLTYINAGHEKPVVFSSKEIKTYLDPTGPAVGAYPDLAYKTGTVRMAPGDCFIAYTDGVTDAKDRKGDFFTKDRLIAELTSPSDSGTGSAETRLETIKTSLYDHMTGAEQFDDITLVLVRRTA